MKKLHMICNAHLDPIWQWNWDEGACTVLSTAQSAVRIAHEYPEAIFCHNEMNFYEIIEENDPALFRQIQELVKEGKWQIIGGWYVQPDCHIPAGESFIRQIEIGRTYFREKFGAAPRTAINFDSFGHSRGLVQILKKEGYDSYIVCRPCDFERTFPNDLFTWVGYEGSEIKVHRYRGKEMYTSPLGKVKQMIDYRYEIFEKNKDGKNDDVGLLLWGVGNHGGGPSRADMNSIREMQKAGVPLLHSTPEAYFDDVTPMFRVEETLGKCFIKCYSSMSRIKRAHAELENRLYLTEKILSVAVREAGMTYDKSLLDEVMRDLSFLAFHDVLCGTVVESGEKSAMQRASHALEILDRLKMQAYLALTRDAKPAMDGEYPVFIFNPNAYDSEEYVEIEVLRLEGMVSDTEYYHITASVDGKAIPYQQIKEEANLNMERRKRLALRVPLRAMSMTRVDLVFDTRAREPKKQYNGDIVLTDSVKSVTISRESGLITSYKVNGRELVNGAFFAPCLFDDNADPWGHSQKTFGKNMRPFRLSDRTEPAFRGFEACHVTEDGNVLTQVESHFICEGITLRLVYKVYKDSPLTDINCYVEYGDKLKCVRLALPVDAEAEVATVFGREYVCADGADQPMQRFLRFDNGMTVLNDGVFAVMRDKTATYLTLLNGSAYCAHRIDDRPYIDETRVITPIEQGYHSFSFRIGDMPKDEVETLATAFNQKPFGYNHFTNGNGTHATCHFSVPRDFTVTACYANGDGTNTVRILNNSDTDKTLPIVLFDAKTELSLRAFEYKTLVVSDNNITEA